MKFYVQELKISGTIEQTADIEILPLLGKPAAGILFEKPLHVVAKAQIINSDVLIDGVVTNQMGFQCVRCLEPFKKNLEMKFQQLYPLAETDFDISDEIREATLIEIPINPVCAAECAGLCPQCGINKNISTCKCQNQSLRISKFADLRWQS